MKYTFYISVQRSIILLLLLTLSLAGSTQSVTRILTADKTIQQLLDWRIVGPFEDTLKNVRDLATLKLSTQEIRDGMVDTIYHQDKDFMYLENVFKTKAKVIGYAVCKVFSDKAQDMTFFINADDGLRCWINGGEAFTVEYTAYSAVIRKGHLKKGINTLIVEISNLVGTWGFDIDITADKNVQHMTSPFSSAIPKNDIREAQQSRVPLKNWRIIGPFSSTLANIDMNQLEFLRFIPGNNRSTIIDTLYQQVNDEVDLSSLFSMNTPGIAYAICDLVTEEDQEMAFLVNADDKMRVWKDSSQIFSIGNFTSGQPVIKKVNVKKGVTRLLVEIRNTSGPWSFDITSCGFDYVRNNALLPWLYTSSHLFLVPEGGSLSLAVADTDFVPIKSISTMKIFDALNRNCYTSQIDLRKTDKLPLPNFLPGAYRYELYTDRDTLTDFFCYGPLDKIYNRKELTQKYENNKTVYDALQPYVKRLDRLLGDYSKAPEVSTSRKIVYCIYKVNEIDSAYQHKKGAALDATGLSLRMFTSAIDHGEENYLLYIPEKVRNQQRPIPLLVIVPYVTNSHPFYTGGVVANTDRIAYISKYAKRYGMAVLWPSSRIFRWYNQTPIVTRSIIESIEDACKYYNIDKKHMYLYGDCSGGLFAFQTAIRKPDLFAAIAMEGPELGSANIDEKEVSGMLVNNIFNLTENLYGKPVFILHSANDQKADIAHSLRLIDSIKNIGGTVYYDNLNNALKSVDAKRYFESESMGKVFSFFDAQRNVHPDTTKKIATYGFYNDTVYGVWVKEKLIPGKATVSYRMEKNRLILSTGNVRKLLIDRNKLDVDNSKVITIELNGRRLTKDIDYKTKGAIIALTNSNAVDGKGNYFTREVYGPVNKVLLNNFAIVRPAQTNEELNLAIAMIDSLWVDEYRNHIQIIDESQVSSAKRSGMNLVYVVNDIDQVSASVLKLGGITLSNDTLVCRGENYPKAGFSFALYFNDNNTDNMYIGLSTMDVPREMLKSIFIKKGWYDFELWHGEYPVIQGNYGMPE